jgi:hypothetical protein
MIGFNVIEFKKAFLDVKAINNRIEFGHMRLQVKFGAYLRRRARQALRYSKTKASAPGGLPFVHKSASGGKSPLKELIFFARDDARNSVVVGPAIFRRGSAPGLVPRVLEQGGMSQKRVFVEPAAQGRPATPRQSETFRRLLKDGRIVLPEREKRTITYNVAKRPFMKPTGDNLIRTAEFKELLRHMVR